MQTKTRQAIHTPPTVPTTPSAPTLPNAPTLPTAPTPPMTTTTTTGAVLARFGHALSDPTRARVLLALRDAPAYPSDLADLLGVSRQSLSNHLTCLRGCGLVVAVPEGRRSRYELADPRLAHALTDLMGVVLAVDPQHVAAVHLAKDIGDRTGNNPDRVTMDTP